MKFLTYLQGLRLLWITNLGVNTVSFIDMILKSAYRTAFTSLLLMAICLYFINWCTKQIAEDEKE